MLKINTTESSPAVITAGSPKPPKAKKTTEPKVSIPMTSGAGAKQKAEKETAKRTSSAGSKSSKGAARVGRKSSGKMSGLDAAAKVLADSGEPRTSQEVVDAMIKRGLWKTSGKTPHATIYAAIIREIAKKGSTSRFRKTDRGHFTVAKGKTMRATPQAPLGRGDIKCDARASQAPSTTVAAGSSP